MDQLSRNLLEKLATDKGLSTKQIQDYIEQELKQLAEDIAKRMRK